MNAFQEHRVVLTGLGVVAANGIGCAPFWETLLGGHSGIGPVTLFNPDGLNCRIAGEVRGFNPHVHLPDIARPDRLPRASQLAMTAAALALDDAGLPADALCKLGCVPVVCGVSTSAMDLIGSRPRPWTAVVSVPHGVGSAIADMFGLPARLITVSNGCASGLDALAIAAAEVRSGRAEAALAAAGDSAITRYVFECFCGARKLSRRNDAPGQASRPFDRQRDGGVIAEGAGVVLMERLDLARARGATCYGEILGYGSRADVWTEAEGSGMASAMRQALDNAGCLPNRIDALSAHAPSDACMDDCEVAAVKQVFGEHAWRMPVTSIKGATGNPMGVGGMHQVIAALLAMRHQQVPPTTNLEDPAPSCDLDHVPGRPRRLRVDRYLVNTHGFGRGNSSLVLARVNA